MENKGCISNQHSNEYFTDEFLRSNLLQILPDGYDICYLINNNNIIFYLYDSTVPLRVFNSEDVIGYVSFYIDKEESDINISYLSVNENIEGFDLRRSGFGTYLLFIAILYSKTQDISKVTLDDMSDGYRTDHNIYLNMGFTYEDEDSGPEMEGDIDEIISYLDEFMDKYDNKTRIRLEELTEYFDDEEWEHDTEDEMDYDEDEMEYGGRSSNIFYGGELIDYNDCLSNVNTHKFFKEEFLNNPLFTLLPEGYDICFGYYGDSEEGSMTSLQFYLYDSTKPMKGERFRYEEAIGSIFLSFENPVQGFFSWRPWNNKAHIPELRINSDLEGYDLQRAGLGTFLILTSIAYCKSINIHEVSLYDASAGFRTENNIYQKIGFTYIEPQNLNSHDMEGSVDLIYNNIDEFIKNKGERFRNKLEELTQYFDDEEWKPDEEWKEEEYDEDMDSIEQEELDDIMMDTSGGKKKKKKKLTMKKI